MIARSAFISKLAKEKNSREQRERKMKKKNQAPNTLPNHVPLLDSSQAPDQQESQAHEDSLETNNQETTGSIR